MTDPVEAGRKNGPDEARATTALLQKDASGLEALVRLHQVRAVRLAYAVLGDRAAAEDVVSDALVKVF